MTPESGHALTVEGLSVSYPGRGWRAPRREVVHDVSLSIAAGETVALVGESGSGKSTIGNAVLGMVEPSAGSIRLGGREISRLRGAGRRAIAADLQAVFQNPYGSLNPSLRVGTILAEPLRAGGMPAAEAGRRVRELLTKVGMPADAADRRPSAFSGGQRQRIAVARAVAMEPKVIVCDEPTSALDVSTQATVLALLRELQAELSVAYLFITHDLAIVREFADRTCVLREGCIVEEGNSASVCDHPRDAYTQRLVAAAPVPDPVEQRRRRERWALLGSDAAA